MFRLTRSLQEHSHRVNTSIQQRSADRYTDSSFYLELYIHNIYIYNLAYKPLEKARCYLLFGGGGG
jgi:hypothetical protein